jgi:hypothetical protein
VCRAMVPSGHQNRWKPIGVSGGVPVLPRSVAGPKVLLSGCMVPSMQLRSPLVSSALLKACCKRVVPCVADTKNPSIPGKIAGMEGFVEPPVGFEPTTPALQERCSGQLS